jgi:hypothetical protein
MNVRDLFIGVVIVSGMNGLASPYVFFAMVAWRAWLPEFLAVNPMMIQYMASLLISTGTLIFSGMPAAIYERVSGSPASTRVSMMIWLGGALFLSLPTAARFL